MKTKEELIALKEEVETVSQKLNELTDDELSMVTGGILSSAAGAADQALQGRIPGVNTIKPETQPGSDVEIKIR